jgi:hypothetical protein
VLGPTQRRFIDTNFPDVHDRNTWIFPYLAILGKRKQEEIPSNFSWKEYKNSKGGLWTMD